RIHFLIILFIPTDLFGFGPSSATGGHSHGQNSLRSHYSVSAFPFEILQLTRTLSSGASHFSHVTVVGRRFSDTYKFSTSLRAGIVGLINVGKSTLFNVVVENGKAQAAKFPFCTIEPNVGVVAVPDPRLHQLSDLSKSIRAVPASIEDWEYNFLSHVREVEVHTSDELASIFLCNINCPAVRCFEDNDIVHVNGKIDPKTGIDLINLELYFSDLDQKNMPRVYPSFLANSKI
ncbi:Ribosome-binding ATPase YchF, partial [Cucurbita argyrosperma subsp. argyrosperma]